MKVWGGGLRVTKRYAVGESPHYLGGMLPRNFWKFRCPENVHSVSYNMDDTCMYMHLMHLYSIRPPILHRTSSSSYPDPTLSRGRGYRAISCRIQACNLSPDPNMSLSNGQFEPSPVHAMLSAAPYSTN